MRNHGFAKGRDGTTVLTKYAEDALQPSNAESRAADAHHTWHQQSTTVNWTQNVPAAPAIDAKPPVFQDFAGPAKTIQSSAPEAKLLYPTTATFPSSSSKDYAPTANGSSTEQQYSSSPGAESALSRCSTGSGLLPEQSSSFCSLSEAENSFTFTNPSCTSSVCSPITLSPEPQALDQVSGGDELSLKHSNKGSVVVDTARDTLRSDVCWSDSCCRAGSSSSIGFDLQQQQQQGNHDDDDDSDDEIQVPLLQVEVQADDDADSIQQQQLLLGCDSTLQQETTETVCEQQQQLLLQEKEQQNAWREVITFALPMLATLAADPVASLVDTAYVGHLGPIQLAGVGMASNIFTSITRLFNAPLLAVTTSSVAAAAAAAAAAVQAQDDDDAAGTGLAAAAEGKTEGLDIQQLQSYRDRDNSSMNTSRSSSTDLIIVLESSPPPQAAAAAEDKADLEQSLLEPCSDVDSACQQQQQQQCSGLAAAVSAALWLALGFALLEVIMLAVGCESLVSVWGAPASSPLHAPTQQFLLLRGLAAPVTVLLLVLQGIFRGLKDASTPLYATIACSVLNIALEPAFIFEPLKLGVRGSALATALAQSLPLVALFVVLQRKYGLNLRKLLTRGLDWPSLGAMFAPTGFLLLRTVSISAVFATATSLVARAGPLAAAAHQVAFQIWLASSLLADSLAVACQTLLARSTAAGELKYARKLVLTSIVMATSLGVVLAVALAAGMHVIPGLFSDSPEVLKLAGQLMPIVAFTQPLNALAFVLDGVLYGAGGFKYASAVMLLCASPSLGLMFAGQGSWNTKPSDQTPPHAFSPAGSDLSSQLSKLEHMYRSEVIDAAASGGSSQGEQVHDSATWGLGQLASGSTYTLITPSQQGYNTVPIHTSSSITISHNLGKNPAAAAAAAGSSSELAAGWGAVGSSIFQHDESEMPAAVLWVWAGLVMLMIMRAVTILVPLAFRCYPFHVLYEDKKQQKQQPGQRFHGFIAKLRCKFLRLKPPPPAAASGGQLAEPLLLEDEETGDLTNDAECPSITNGTEHILPCNKQDLKQDFQQYEVFAGASAEGPDELVIICGDSPNSSSISNSSLGSNGGSSDSLHALH